MTTKKKPSRRQALRAWHRRGIAPDATPQQAALIRDLQGQLRANEILDRWEDHLRQETAARLRREAEAVNAAWEDLQLLRSIGTVPLH
jgi:hypothetical protein